MNRGPASSDELGAGVSLDALFASNARARPDALALADPTDRENFTSEKPRRLTYSQLNDEVDRLARQLRMFELPPEAVVAVQLPNIAENVIALLAILRAGLVAAPVPMLWRKSDLVEALTRIEPKAFITLSRLGNDKPAEVACEVAIELFSLSFPCAFGTNVPDGIFPLEEAGVEDEPMEFPALPANALAMATFDATRDGFYPVGRSHAQWLAAGLATLLESRIGAGDTIVSTLPPSSLAGLSSAFIPWLLSGGALELVHGFSREAIRDAGPGGRPHLVAPAASLAEVAQAHGRPLRSCIAVHRSPQTLSLDFGNVAAELLVDLTILGETGAIALHREDARRSRPVPLGAVTAPSGAAGAPVVIDTRIGADGILALSGAMIPRRQFSPEPGSPQLETDRDNYVKTGFKCEYRMGKLAIEPSPEGIATVGGIRYGLDDLNRRVAKSAHGATVQALPDALLGQRLRVFAESELAVKSLKDAGHSALVFEAVETRAARRRAG
jgi:hypothetical protein